MPAAPSVKSKAIACFGAVHMDHIAHAGLKILAETSTPARLTQKPGGVAANVARALELLGSAPVLAGTVGDDALAQAVKAALKDDGLRTALVERPGFVTGQYLALHNPDGSLAGACVDDRILSEAPAGLFDPVLQGLGDTQMWFLDANLPEPVIARLLSRVGNRFVAADAVSIAKAPRLRAALARIDVLFANRREAATLAPTQENDSLHAISEALMATGLKAAIITDGAAGATVCKGTTRLQLDPEPVEIQDVTGAGDALIAGTLAGLARDLDLFEAARAGMTAARMTLQATGAVPRDLAWSRIAPAR
ncbi:PfkB family carbohydrate kinase [Roseibium sp. RKSG952]|uniref:PfkB family carbohydrate kinase n=1 Tax=Roseibium sp. RKSG952 TaxID=2529384 RepID=UPI0012BB945B|nr:PfkB family carbohydrate kinase [Roseibium sp. RKSG952]MTH96898.1 carbohydrate kinase [Roseibium sp. RKSG952]